MEIVFCIIYEVKNQSTKNWLCSLREKERWAKLSSSVLIVCTAAAVASHQLCLTLCDPTDGSPPGFPVPGILQARTLEWVGNIYSTPLRQKEVENVRGQCVLSCFSRVQLFATLWPVAHQAPLPMGFSSQEYWSGLPCPPSRDLPNPGIEPMSPET